MPIWQHISVLPGSALKISLLDYNFRHIFQLLTPSRYEKYCPFRLSLFWVFAGTINIPCDVLVSLSATFRLAVRLYNIAPFFLSRQEDPPRLNGLDIGASILQTYDKSPSNKVPLHVTK